MTRPGQRVRSHKRQVDLLCLLDVLALLSGLDCWIGNTVEESEGRWGNWLQSHNLGVGPPQLVCPTPLSSTRVRCSGPREEQDVLAGSCRDTRTETSRLEPGTCQSSIHPPGEHTPLPTARHQLTVPENKMEPKVKVARRTRKQAKIRIPRQRKQKHWNRRRTT